MIFIRIKKNPVPIKFFTMLGQSRCLKIGFDEWHQKRQDRTSAHL